jgi:hypothetical protein
MTFKLSKKEGQTMGMKELIEKIKEGWEVVENLLYAEISISSIIFSIISSIIPEPLRPYWVSLVNFLNKDISYFFSATEYDIDDIDDEDGFSHKLHSIITDPQYFHLPENVFHHD